MIGFHFVGNFEDFKAFGALLELSIGGCKKIDCKNALEVLPTMPWAGQIQKLNLSATDAEGTKNVHKFRAPVRIFRNIPNPRCYVLCAACNTNTHARTGNIQVLKSCSNLASVNFNFCEKIEGEHTSNELS